MAPTTQAQAEAAATVARAGEPFGWSRGTVRALIVLTLVITIIGLAVGTTAVAVLRARAEFLEQIVLLIVGAVLTLGNLAVGFYFSQRPQTPTNGE